MAEELRRFGELTPQVVRLVGQFPALRHLTMEFPPGLALRWFIRSNHLELELIYALVGLFAIRKYFPEVVADVLVYL